MPFDAIVNISGINGESTDESHPGWIEVLAFGLGVRQKLSTTKSSAGGASAERADFRELVFKKLLDVSSAQLALACAQGRHIDSISLSLCSAGTDKMQFMEYELKNCMIWRVATSGGESFPTETVRIDYGKIQWKYTLQNRTGGIPTGHLVTGWDRERNCSL